MIPKIKPNLTIFSLRDAALSLVALSVPVTDAIAPKASRIGSKELQNALIDSLRYTQRVFERLRRLFQDSVV